MSDKSYRKPLALALSATFAAAMSAAPIASADSNPFGMQDLGSGYMQVAEGKCGGMDKKKEGKCGEAKCGGKAKEAKCGEGKCGGGKSMKEGKCGEGKDMKEGKCGGKDKKEGKCGGKG